MTKLISTNPGKNYQVVGDVEVSTEKEIKNRIKKAHQAQKKWVGLGVEGRVKLLSKIPHEFKRRKEELALLVTREMGMPISASRSEVDDAMRYFNWYLENASKYLSSEIIYEDENIQHKIFHEPIGVVAVIIPWNYPVSNFIWGAGQNLIVGNTVVLKHSEECPLTGKLIEEIVNSVLPDGVFSEVLVMGKLEIYWHIKI